jgi:putative isomerase
MPKPNSRSPSLNKCSDEIVVPSINSVISQPMPRLKAMIFKSLATVSLVAATLPAMAAENLTMNTKNATPATSAPVTESAGVDAFKHQLGSDRVQKLHNRLNALNKDISERGMITVEGYPEPLLTGYEYRQVYDWDTYFENLYLSYYGNGTYALNNFKAFLSLQKPDGFIQRAFGNKEWGTTQPYKPFLAQLAVLASKQNGNGYEWLRGAYYEGLKKYFDRWFAYDTDENGLPVWDSADANGMDNQARRVGEKGSFFCEGADLASYLYRELETMAFIAAKLGHTADEASFNKRADALAQAVNTILWDEKDAFYYDRNQKTGQPIRIKSVAGFLPLWAGMVPPERAKRLVQEHLTNEKEFWLKNPVATFAATEPDYYQGSKNGECNWRGPAWLPTNYMIMHGPLRYGFKDVARDLADRTFRMALDENPTTREFYDADTGRGNGLNPFWGWSSLAYVMPLEVELGYDPMANSTEIQPWLSRNFGIKEPKR